MRSRIDDKAEIVQLFCLARRSRHESGVLDSAFLAQAKLSSAEGIEVHRPHLCQIAKEQHTASHVTKRIEIWSVLSLQK